MKPNTQKIEVANVATVQIEILDPSIMGERYLQDGVLAVDSQAIDPQPVPTGGIRQRED